MCKSNLILFQFKADITVCLNIPLADIAKYSPGRKVSLVKVLDIYEIHILYLVKYYIMRTDLKKIPSVRHRKRCLASSRTMHLMFARIYLGSSQASF